MGSSGAGVNLLLVFVLGSGPIRKNEMSCVRREPGSLVGKFQIDPLICLPFVGGVDESPTFFRNGSEFAGYVVTDIG